MPRTRGFNNGSFAFFTPGAPGVVIGTHVGGIAKIDVSPLFFRYCLEFRIFLFKPLLHQRFVTFPCPVQRLLTSDAELSQKPSHGRGAQNHMELILDQLRHHRARPQRKLEFQLQRVLPRHRAVNPLHARPSSFGGRPGTGFAFRAPQPPRRYCASHLYMAVRPTPKIWATTSGLSPSCTRCTARSRIASSVL